MKLIRLFIGRTFIILAITAFSPSVYVLCATADIPISYLLGWIWLGQDLSWFSFLGTGLICAGIFTVVCPSLDPSLLCARSVFSAKKKPIGDESAEEEAVLREELMLG